MNHPRANVWHRHPADVERLLEAAVKDPRVVTLAGGVPADELFPTAEIDAATAAVMREDGAAALQYGWPEGNDRLREHIAAWLATDGVQAAPDEILVTSGAQQGLQLLGQLLVPEGAPLIVESPTYAAALQAFDLRRPAWRPVRRTAEGLDLAELERALRDGARALYLVATGHNPTGGVLSDAERAEALRLAAAHDAWVIDDDAYGSIQFGSSRPPPLRAAGRHLDRVVHLGSFSKVLAPGLRIGFLAGPASLIAEAKHLKQAQDLETATLTQQVLARWLDDHALTAHIDRAVALYRSRRDVMVGALGDALPAAAWEVPVSGFSLLLRLPSGLDARALLPEAIRAGTAYEPAEPYFVAGHEPSAVRLSFSNLDEERIRAGVGRLAEVVEAAGR